MDGRRTPVPKPKSTVSPKRKGIGRRLYPTLGVTASIATITIALLKAADPDVWRAAGVLPPWDYVEQNPIAAGAAMGLFALTLLCGRYRRALLRRMVKPLVQSRYGHLDPHAAEKEFPLYPDLVRNDLPLLRMSTREFAKRTGLPLHAAWYIADNPDFFPRPELILRICDALLTPPERLRTGGDYGPTCTLSRLLRLHDCGQAMGWTKERILQADAQKRSSLLSRIQCRLLKDLDSTAHGRNHE